MKKKILLVILGFILGISFLNYTNPISYKENKIDREQRVKKAGFWEIGPIEIDDTDPSKNWSITAAIYDWCSGSGTWKDPYVIENVTIDGQNLYNCIRIDNSNIFFVIKNCTLKNGKGVYWHSGGIRLENVTNGRLINNICSFNQQGIYLLNSNNNTISGNIANNNTIHGIVLYDRCNDTKIEGNTANFNEHFSIHIRNSNNTFISNNNCSYNGGTGMALRGMCNSEIINNTANDNGVFPTVGSGISLQTSKNITISFNHLQGNGMGMNIYNNQDCKIVNNTAISNEDFGIDIDHCTNIIVIDNNVSYNHIGVMLQSESSDYDLSYNNTVSRNIVKNNYWGIYLFYTYNNTILENIAKDNYCGIYLRRSNYNNVTGNVLIGNTHCIIEEECENNILENNNCDINPKISGYQVILLILVIPIIFVHKIRRKNI